jgi:general secretion pathway protein J
VSRELRVPTEEQGFTLLELLVGITVFSLIVVAVYSGLRLGTRSWEAGEAKSVTSNQIRLVDGFIRRQLTKAYPVLTRVQNSGWQLQFEGTENGVRFITDMPLHLGLGGLYEVGLTVTEEGEERKMMFTRQLFHPDRRGTSVDDDIDETVLIDDLVGAEFGYFGATQENLQSKWHPTWDSMPRLPTLVRVRTTSQAVGEWPELIVRLRVDGPRYESTVDVDGDLSQIDDATTSEPATEEELDELDGDESDPDGDTVQ